jgi:hypothetical protein
MYFRGVKNISLKKILSFFLLVVLLSVCSCKENTKENIPGKWQMIRVGSETIPESDRNAYIEFDKDGKLIFLVDTNRSVGKWELSKDEKTVMWSSGDNKKNWTIISLNKHEFVYAEEGDTTKITLTK